MTSPRSTATDGIEGVSEALGARLRAYIEAQYHIKNEDLIGERAALLCEDRAIASEPFLEATPTYKLGSPLADTSIPEHAKGLLTDLLSMNVGVFPRLYQHQEDALLAFLRDKRDVIVATGTGSGKTETFLFSILGMLAEEAAERPESANLPGFRALLLYPMNALVNDQLARVRRLFGDNYSSARISLGRDRPVRFASYTGRTPYPGKKCAKRDGTDIRPLFEDYYLPLLSRPDIVSTLTLAGKWPSKDLASFYAADRAKQGVTRSQKPFTRWNWDERLRTASGDRELMTRHEVQDTCPDLLITNYSMLEYMLLRPIERSIFAQTKAWLQANDSNVLTLVLDEAHLYSGTAGAEVALLIRRLIARLGITRERVRCILTSASFGGGSTASAAAQDFARELTGSRNVDKQFELVVGTPEERPTGTGASREVAQALVAFDLALFEPRASSVNGAAAEVGALFRRLGISEPVGDDEESLRNSIYHALEALPVADRLISLISGTATSLAEAARELFPFEGSDDAKSALSALLALCSYARRDDGRVFLASRVHMLFRGLPGLYACSDQACSAKRTGGDGAILGRLYTDPRTSCECESHARVFELLTHRDCGSAFLRAYILGSQGDFLWSEPNTSRRHGPLQLSEIHLLVEGEPHNEQSDKVRPAWLDIRTGLLRRSDPGQAGFRRIYTPDRHESDDGTFTFQTCPICLKSWRQTSQRIMDHATKGEDPFAALVATQLATQPESKPATRRFPNAGRKVLLFSDGRQKAARLARDLPRAVELDVFRQTIAVAGRQLALAKGEARINNELYIAFVSVLASTNLLMFDGDARATLVRDIEQFRTEFEGDLSATIDLLATDAQPSAKYQSMLLRQLCARFYSIADTTVGTVRPAGRDIRRIAALLEAEFPTLTTSDGEALTQAWIQACLDSFSINASLETNIRWQAGGHPSAAGWGTPTTFGKKHSPKFSRLLGIPEDSVERIATHIAKMLAEPVESTGSFLIPRKVIVDIDLDRAWFQCQACTRLSPMTIRDHCLYCISSDVLELSPGTSKYLTARKGYWRQPVVAALANSASIENIAVEEHTAQLSHRDRASVQATTERYELQFQDLLINDSDRPIDVLSCTTTMEVGIDIGSLLAVGLRNVPPRRSNYQQRAGRAGRRGSAVSTVITYAQNGPHDSYYFNSPEKIITGEPPTPQIKTDNSKIARRHVHSFLLQTFFNESYERGGVPDTFETSSIEKALGSAGAFFLDDNPIGFVAFCKWIDRNILVKPSPLSRQIASWLPAALGTEIERQKWTLTVAEEFVKRLVPLQSKLALRNLSADGSAALIPNEGTEAEDDETPDDPFDVDLLAFLFEENLLPTYAFPTHLAGFLIEEPVVRGDWQAVRVKEFPQQAMDKALSEYAPGRLIVVNKKTYRSGGVIASFAPDALAKAAPLFDRSRRLAYCTLCSYVQERTAATASRCPVCSSSINDHLTIEPEVFVPEGARPLLDDDREQDVTYATMAQFPVPVGEDLQGWSDAGARATTTYTIDRQLITVNKGKQGRDGTFSGFLVCDVCGFASIDSEPTAGHERPYLVALRRGRRPQRCKGQLRKVYLGGIFTTDLFLLRIELSTPIVSDTQNQDSLRILEDALYSASEALQRSACLHKSLDISQSELGAGFRLNPATEGLARYADLYIYDATSGGAGYSELAAQNVSEILAGAIELLDECPLQCQSSCQECLRHFHNQHLKDRLDRHLGADLLRYALTGSAPRIASLGTQRARLGALSRSLELSGLGTSSSLDGVEVPLCVTDGKRSVIVGTYGALMGDIPATFSGLANKAAAVFVSDYELLRDLPSAYRRVRDALGEPHG